VLADGPLAATEVRQRAKDDEIASRTLDRAKKSLGVRSTKASIGGRWEWGLPVAPGDVGVLPANKVANSWRSSKDVGKVAKNARGANGCARTREPTLLDVLGSEEAFFEALATAFDATEITGEVMA